jgi:hypothetical protein
MIFPLSLVPPQVKLYLYGALALGLVGIGAYSTHKWYQGDIANLERDRDAWQKSAKVYEQVAEDENAARIAANTAATQGTIRAQAAINARDDYKRKLNELAKASPSVMDYLSIVRPLDVRRLRRTEAGCSDNLEVSCTEKPIATNPDSPDGRRDKPGP